MEVVFPKFQQKSPSINPVKAKENAMQNLEITLFGDSIIDNGVYVASNELSVLQHLQSKSSDFSFEQRAVDGDTTKDVLESQLLSDFTGNSVLSIGGNDLLQNMQLVANQEQRTAVDVLESLGGVADGFVERYDNILSMLNGPALVMTIYNPSFERDRSMAHLQRSCELVVGMFNDIIQQLVRKHEKDLLELREIFIDERDYANPIEPSHVGGGKLADAILNWCSSR